MKIVGDKIVEATEDDIVDGTFILPDGVTTIGESAFSGIQSLNHIPSGVLVVEDNAFEYCKGLLTMPDTIVSVGEKSFFNCEFLQNISMGLVQIPRDSFYRCKALETIPDSVVEIGAGAFKNCFSLKTMPNTIRKIGHHSFFYCTSLENVSSQLETIPESAFYNCRSLTTLPSGIVRVEDGAFANCRSLQAMPDTIEEVGDDSFRACTSLQKVSCNLKKMGAGTFMSCTSLEELPHTIEDFGSRSCLAGTKIKTVYLDHVKKIGVCAFADSMIEKFITPYGEIERYSTIYNVVQYYLYLYANSLLKEPYKDYSEFLQNEHIFNLFHTDLLFQGDTISKFQKLFFKMRKDWSVPVRLFEKMSMEMVDAFQLKAWNQVKDLFWFCSNRDMAESVHDLLFVFGIFENDQYRSSRIMDLKHFLFPDPYILTKEQYDELSNIGVDNDGWLFPNNDDTMEFISERQKNYQKWFQMEKVSEYRLQKNVEIPKEFECYLQEDLSLEDLRFIHKLSGTYGKQINDFVKENYQEVSLSQFVLRNQYRDDEECYSQLFIEDLLGHITNSSLHQMFDGSIETFNPAFYQFFMENYSIILRNAKYQSYIPDICKRFSKIQDHYRSTSGAEKLTLKQVIDYLNEIHYDYAEGNEEAFQKMKQAGVFKEEAFQYYEKAYEENQTRRMTSLVKRKKVYTVDGFVIQAELLRKDEVDAALVGEVNNTNCCQVYGGVGHNCMAHAVYSDDGGVFVTKLLESGKETLLTQSWDWQNNNVYCHDNIEGTAYLKKNKKLQAAVAKVFQMDGEFIIEKSKNEVENYITARKKTIERSLMPETEKAREFFILREMEERQVIRVVTSGASNNDLELSNYFSSSIQVNQAMFLHQQKFTLVNFQPVAYNSKQAYFNSNRSAYTDSHEQQYIIAGSLENLCLGKQEPLVPIYRDERRVMQDGKDIRDFTFHKIKMIEKEAYPEDIWQYQSLSRKEILDDHEQVYLGEDWYMVYEVKNDKTVYISDLARTNTTLSDEGKQQLDEMNHAIYELLKTYDVIEADLKEDTSYLLYLINKKRGYVEQIGKDVVYPFQNEMERRSVSAQEQLEILENMKKIRNDGNPENRMHFVTFKRGPRLEDELNISRRR